MTRVKHVWLVLFGLAFGVAAAACFPPAAVSGPVIDIEDAWGRPSPQVASAGAFYMVIHNRGQEADKLVGAQSTACTAVELHESFQASAGTMGMRPVVGGVVDLPAGARVEFKAGGLHVMCIGKQVDFQPGTNLPLTLQLERSGPKIIIVQIRKP